MLAQDIETQAFLQRTMAEAFGAVPMRWLVGMAVWNVLQPELELLGYPVEYRQGSRQDEMFLVCER